MVNFKKNLIKLSSFIDTEGIVRVGGWWKTESSFSQKHSILLYQILNIIGDQTLTFEKLSTEFIQIEAQTHSRPICFLRI